MKTIVVDIGGSGARVGEVLGGAVAGIRRVDAGTLDELVEAIESIDRRPGAVAVSVPGLVDARRGHVEQCRAVPWVNGPLAETLGRALNCPVSVLNDGSAHALAMRREPDLRLGAICLSLGTSVGFGVLASDGALLPSLSGLNWEVGDLALSTRATTREAWWALGEPGLAELQRNLGAGPGRRQFGYRLGAFAKTLAIVFQAQTVGFSGGHVARYWNEMAEAVESEIGSPLMGGRRPVLLPLRSVEPALDGLAVLLSD